MIMKKLLILLVVLLTGSLNQHNVSAQRYLKVSDNNRFLVKDNGDPFFWMGDTGWELVHKLDLNEIDHYMRNRAAKGFTVIQFVLLGECDGITKPTPEGYLPLNNQNPADPNEAYFKKVDKVVEMAAGYGLYLAILPTWGAHAEDKHHFLFENLNIFTPENAYKYGAFLGKRYKDYWNIVWITGGDRIPDGNEDIWTNMIKGLRDGNNKKQLITYHVCGRHSVTEYPEIAKQLDFYAMQSGHGNVATPTYKMVETDYAVSPVKPVIDIEPVYEDIPIGFNPINGYTTDYEPRRAMYWSVIAGAFGTTYGNNSVWQMTKEGYPKVLEPLATWDEGIESRGSKQVRYLKDLFLSRPFLTRIPDNSLIVSDNFSMADYKVATRDGTLSKKDATYIIAYFPIAGGFKLKTDVIKSDRIKAWYFDPRTGLAYYIGEFDNTGSFSPPWSARIRQSMGGPDWVIVVDDASKAYPAPGN